MPALKLKQISKSYGKGKPVLKDFSLEIQDSEFLVLVGPSGCGKSTLIRCIAGLEEIDSGEISFGDQRLDLLAPKDRRLSMVFQNYALYPHKTVYENIAFPLQFQKPNPTHHTEVLDLASRLGLSDLLQRKPKELSGGQRQRVALARALIKKPEIFLLDEPLSNLDAKLRSLMRSEIQRLHQDSGKTFIYVTHDQIEALSLGDRIAVLKDGEILQLDSPENIYHQPANTFVASFIGSPATNLIPLSPTSLASFNPDFKAIFNPAILGIRPEYLSLEPPSEPWASLKLVFESLELLGSETIVYACLESLPEQKIILKIKPAFSGDKNLLSKDLQKSKFFIAYCPLPKLYYFDILKLHKLS